MILKKIMHFFCGRSLEKETAAANALIHQLEQREKAARDRLHAKADEYRAEVAAFKEKRDAELKELIKFLNEQVGSAQAYVSHLGDFQDKMFVCFDSWMNTSMTDQQIELLAERIDTKLKILEFIAALQVELNRLTQRNERAEWNNMIRQRPIQVSSTYIERTARHVRTSQKNNSDSIRHDLSRLKSHSMRLQTELKELRHERDKRIAASRELMEEHKANKADLSEQYRKCSEIFGKIKDKLSDRFGSALTENDLANSWIAEIEGDVTLPKLISVHRGTAGLQLEANEEFNGIQEEFNAIRAKIETNHKLKNFDTLDQDKVMRERLFRARQVAGDKRREISTARQVVYSRGNELRERLGKFESLQPDESIRRIMQVFSMGKDFDVHRAIGVSTREDRRKHYQSRNPNQ
ncbi:hypothetical protein [Achromobacter xylosoxidans]|uniref:hypothetical protein n=1 Tax=Alcaligenes xylosoxydans xylosoxydans TaxID=85698 RepID=UPI001177968E|nr:hypothetical protein [Achromobacter xylosoxidans]